MLAQEVRNLENENEVLKKSLEKLRTDFKKDGSKPMACEHCKFYIQHYVRSNSHCSGYIATHCGHCTHGQCKKRKPDDSCKYFELGTYETRKF